MRVHVVSDVHGNVEALARAGEGADALVILGDLIDFVDYADPGKGILGALFGAEKVAVFARLRAAGDWERTAAYARTLWTSIADPSSAVQEAIHEQYTALFGALSVPTYATPGNVDVPELWPDFAGPSVRVLDGDVAKIGGLRFGFVGGGVRPAGIQSRPGAAWRPYLRTEASFTDSLDALGEVDVLCTHVPPTVPDLTYDVVTRGFEGGSDSVLWHIARSTPRWSLFGHVHQPLAQRCRLGRTECCNVGHFKQSGRPFVLRW